MHEPAPAAAEAIERRCQRDPASARLGGPPHVPVWTPATAEVAREFPRGQARLGAGDRRQVGRPGGVDQRVVVMRRLAVRRPARR